MKWMGGWGRKGRGTCFASHAQDLKMSILERSTSSLLLSFSSVESSMHSM